MSTCDPCDVICSCNHKMFYHILLGHEYKIYCLVKPVLQIQSVTEPGFYFGGQKEPMFYVNFYKSKHFFSLHAGVHMKYYTIIY